MRLGVPPLITFEPIGRSHRIQQGGHATEPKLNAIIVNPLASTILIWWTYKLLRWTQDLHQSAWDNEGLSLVRMLIRPFLCDSLINTCVKMGPVVGPIF
jgi:hypothetical protein